VLELLLAELPAQGHKWLDDDATQPHGELSQWAAQRSPCATRYKP
jgi:formate dehydrogenase major subunit